MTAPYHIPVLLHESIEALEIKPDGLYVDATFGGGGHSREILGKLGNNGRLMVMDRDPEALANLPDDNRVIAVQSNFRFIHNFLHYHSISGVDGILADLGVSSHQFDTGSRGFSFRFSAPLDMRMSATTGKDAKQVLNSYSKESLESLFKNYGEVENSRRVAELICKSREESPIETTDDLGRALASILPKFNEHKYLAKIYQALRIEVNDEMVSLEKFIPMAIKSLSKEGILAVITYHSIEDRIVKNGIKSAINDGIMELVCRKPILPAEEEISANSRARSAKLRVARKK
ncbi:MAG: 16S rRNA (cytosine(1402)-N(4))-methyltransferase RsmH [Bacteroidales bacterium]|nr:16S rRNA (cytosine(1402)-N(4))-methyltransferase RsmH [Bacteroidales bacterium]